MMRKPNTDMTGRDFLSNVVQSVWQKGLPIQDYNPNQYRLDCCGAYMAFGEYGNSNSDYGWEIDHINPVSNGGNDALDNLQPMNWKNNRSKADSIPGQSWHCSVGGKRSC